MDRKYSCLESDKTTIKESGPKGAGFGLAPGRGKIALPPEEARLNVVPLRLLIARIFFLALLDT